MDPIREGASGVAVEDIQDRLKKLGYEISEAEQTACSFGSSTAEAVTRFRLDHDLPLGSEIDSATWAALVDECYELGPDAFAHQRLPLDLEASDALGLYEQLVGERCRAQQTPRRAVVCELFRKQRAAFGHHLLELLVCGCFYLFCHSRYKQSAVQN